jgi:hypothetical protein
MFKNILSPSSALLELHQPAFLLLDSTAVQREVSVIANAPLSNLPHLLSVEECQDLSKLDAGEW